MPHKYWSQQDNYISNHVTISNHRDRFLSLNKSQTTDPSKYFISPIFPWKRCLSLAMLPFTVPSEIFNCNRDLHQRSQGRRFIYLIYEHGPITDTRKRPFPNYVHHDWSKNDISLSNYAPLFLERFRSSPVMSIFNIDTDKIITISDKLIRF